MPPQLHHFSAVDCGCLRSLENGIIVFDDTTYNSEASYSCNPGYILTGNEMRICSGSGVWNGTIPICTGEKTL